MVQELVLVDLTRFAAERRMNNVSVEKFLNFWFYDRHLATIITALIVTVLLVVVYIAYRAFFGPPGVEGPVATSGGGIDVGAL